MSSDYDMLLDASIEHLQQLKRAGVQVVDVQQSTLKALAKPVERSMARNVSLSAPAVAKTEITPVTAPPAVVSKPLNLNPGEKEAAMQNLRGRVQQCFKCEHLVASRKHVVFGVGNIHTELMFVGEAPGSDEDLQGEPFVGKAGQLLTKIIQAMNFSRDKVYIANVLKCRPDTPGQLTGNRKPTPAEMNTCLPYLLEQVNIINPKVIVALGGTAVEGLFGKPLPIMRLRGQWMEFNGIPVMPTYHPAYLLRNQLMTEKRKVWEDMLQVLERLQLPISDKQRNYFLKSA